MLLYVDMLDAVHEWLHSHTSCSYRKNDFLSRIVSSLLDKKKEKDTVETSVAALDGEEEEMREEEAEEKEEEERRFDSALSTFISCIYNIKVSNVEMHG